MSNMSSNSNSNNTNSNSEEEEEVNLDEILANMNIDADFGMSLRSFRMSIQGSPSREDPTTRWEARWRRDEVYSHRYIPDTPEREELGTLEATLGQLQREKSNEIAQLRALCREAPRSIILQRGVLLADHIETELVMLTHGIVLASIDKRTAARALERVILWPHISAMEQIDERCWNIQTFDEDIQMTCANRAQLQSWWNAMERAIIEHHVHAKTSQPQKLGWQYEIVHKPPFTMAVTGNEDLPIFIVEDEKQQHSLDVLDTYRGYSALHYAARLGHVGAMQRLLEAGADPNIPDEEGRTPMYYAVRDKRPGAVEVLERYGGTESQLAIDEESGALFGQVASTDAKVQSQRDKKAEAAKAEIAKNMQLLQQRGEKINELDSKARQLNEGAGNYADMARQLKEKSKKKSRWGLW